MIKPRFIADESWDDSGDVDVWFMDRTSNKLMDKVRDELNLLVPGLPLESRSTYHVERLVNHIFNTTPIKLDKKTKQWDLIEYDE